MNNPYLLKKQLKDNEEELTNYLRDMNIWHENMKRKHPSSSAKVLKTDNSDEKKKSKINNSSKPVLNKISAWNYSAWDKFDVDKACEDMDLQNELQKNDSDNSSNGSVESKQSEALYEKNLGNALVQKKKWAEAILRYTRAIEYYEKDPLFYANRALCYLKTNDFKLAIRDCTASLKLDNTYVKTYQRRSAAFMALQMYYEAKKDLNEILKLEPYNKQATLDLEVVNKKIKENEMQIKTDKTLQKENTINNLRSKNITSSILCKNVENPLKIVSPQWPLRVNCKEITSKQKPPHLRSKKPLLALKINDIEVNQEEEDNIQLLQSTLKEVCEKTEKEGNYKNKEAIIAPIKDSVQIEKKHSVVLPPAPRTYVQLKQDWAYLQNDSKLLFHYLKQIPGKRLPSIVCNSMDNDLLVDILRILRLEFIQNQYDITDYLIGISQLPRLQMLVMFCSDHEVSCIKELLSYVSKFVPEYTFKNLKNAFGI